MFTTSLKFKYCYIYCFGLEVWFCISDEFDINFALSAFNRCEIDWRNTVGQKESARKPQKAGQHDDFYGAMLHVPTAFLSILFKYIQLKAL